jgi:predicted hotdog family 3-hydroxylacyl-ACP dehydratase
VAFPDVQSLIPHSGPSCLLDAVLSVGQSGAVCRASLPADHPYMTDTGVHPLLAIELFAQAAAVHRALADEGASEVPAGGRLAAAQVKVHVRRLDAGTRLLVLVEPDASLGGLVRFAGKLLTDGEEKRLVAVGTVSIVVGPWAVATAVEVET